MFIIESFILGLLVALNPCQLAINISALTYLNGRSNSAGSLLRQGWMYAAGRTISYSLLGIVMMALVRLGLNVGRFQSYLDKAEIVLPYLFMAIGLFLIYRALHTHVHHGTECHNCGSTIKKGGPYGALALGLMLAFAFCPESAILFFGMLLPLGIAHSYGWLAPVAFALAAGVPVIVMVCILAQARKKVLQLNQTFTHIQQWINAAFGIAFIAAAIILLVS